MQREWRDIWPKISVEEGRDRGLDQHRFPVEKGAASQGSQSKDPLLDHENARVRGNLFLLTLLGIFINDVTLIRLIRCCNRSGAV